MVDAIMLEPPAPNESGVTYCEYPVDKFLG